MYGVEIKAFQLEKMYLLKYLLLHSVTPPIAPLVEKLIVAQVVKSLRLYYEA
jgi:hypothetical protein